MLSECSKLPALGVHPLTTRALRQSLGARLLSSSSPQIEGGRQEENDPERNHKVRRSISMPTAKGGGGKVVPMPAAQPKINEMEIYEALYGPNAIAIDVTKKLLIYHTLYLLNLSFSNIVTHCRTLQEAGACTAKSTRLFQGYAQELRAEINQDLLETMHQTELDDWGRFGKIRQAEEKRLSDPDDVFIHAEARRQELRKRRKK